MRRRGFIAVLVATPAVLAGLGWSRSAVSAQANPPEYVIRYAVFTGKLKGPNPYQNGEIAPIFQQLQDGSDLELGASPEGFMAALRKAEPNYDFTLVLSGNQRGAAGSPITINAGPSPKDPRKITLKHQFVLKPKSATTVELANKGDLKYDTPNIKSQTDNHWAGECLIAILQRTYIPSTLIAKNTEQPLVYVYSIVKADR